jgi:hypothetical protein
LRIKASEKARKLICRFVLWGESKDGWWKRQNWRQCRTEVKYGKKEKRFPVIRVEKVPVFMFWLPKSITHRFYNTDLRSAEVGPLRFNRGFLQVVFCLK